MSMPVTHPVEPCEPNEVLRQILLCDTVIGETIANIRQTYDEEGINLLTRSIQEFGVRQPILVQEIDRKYHLIDGHRRYLASLRAGLETIPARVRTSDAVDAEIPLEQVVLNLQEEVPDWQKAQALDEYQQRTGQTITQLAAKVGLSKSQVSRLLKLLDLSPFLKSQLKAGSLPSAVALELNELPVDEQEAGFQRYQAGESTRDALRRARKQRARNAEQPVLKVSRATAQLSANRIVTVSAPGLDLDGYIQLLQELLDHARKSRSRGLALGTALKVLQETSQSV